MITPNPSGWDYNWIWGACLVDTGTELFYYYLSGETAPNIGLATSPDGKSWTKYPGNPIWTSPCHPSVIKDGSTWKMWYSDLSGEICYATSSNGIDWITAATGLMKPGGAGTWDVEFWSVHVIKENDGYRMWYTGNGADQQIGLATSPDGMSWTKFAGNPVLKMGPPGSFDSSDVAFPCVLNMSGEYRMWYGGHDGSSSAIGYATSPDGAHWTKYSDNPVLGYNSGWDAYCSMPRVVLRDSTLKMMYTGMTNNWFYTAGLAESFGTPPDTPELLFPLNDRWTNDSTPQFQWSFGTPGEQTAFQLQIDDDPSFSPALFDSGRLSGNSTSFSIPSPLADGTYHWKVRYWDRIGVPSGWSLMRRVRVDATAPENPYGISSSSHKTGQWSVNPRIEVSWSLPPDGEPLSGYGGFATTWDNSSSTVPGGTVDTTANSAISPPFAQGAGIYFHIRARDIAGNWNPTAAHLGPFLIDTATPDNPFVLESTSHVVGMWNGDNTVDMSWSGGSGTVSGSEGYSVAWDGDRFTVPPESVVLAGDASSATSPPLEDGGSWYFHIRVKDRAGTWNMTARHSGPYFIDATPPDNPSGLAGVGASPRNWSRDGAVTVSWSAPEGDLSGVSGYSVLWDRSPGSLPAGSVILSGDALQAKSPPLPDGTNWYVHIRAQDGAGNWNRMAVHLGPFWVDATPPENPQVIVSPTHAPDIASGDIVVNVSWPAGNDAASGVAGYAWSWDDRPDTAPAGTTISDAGTLSASSGALPDGSWYFHLRTVDGAGNWAPSAVHGGPYIVDRSIALSKLGPVITKAIGRQNTTVAYGTELMFSADAYSPAGLPLTFSWLENGKVLGTGRSFTRTFPPGPHTVVLVVSDGKREATRSFDFFVQQEPTSGRRAGPPSVALSPYIVGVAILLPLGLLLLALARTEVGKYRFWILFFMLYTRIGRNEVLDNELRGMIRGHIQADPGIHYNELLRRITAGNGTVAHHLMILEREGIIKSRRDGGLRRFYPGEMKLTEVHVRLTGVQRLILDQVRRKEGLSQRTIAAALDIPYLTVNRQVRKMVSLGVLRLEWRGISSRCHIGDGWRTDSPGLQAGTDAFLQTMSTQD